MSADNRRLLVAIDSEIREINRETINPMFETLRLADLKPVVLMVAKARARYLHALYEIARKAPDNTPSDADIEQLTKLRHIYEELLKGSQALETAIEREYLDVGK